MMFYRRLRNLPTKWRIVTISFLFLAQAIPLMYVLTLLLPASQQALQVYPNGPAAVFQHAISHLSVEQTAFHVTPSYRVQLNTVSQTNIPVAERRDLTLLYQDGLLVGSSQQQKKNLDTLSQQIEIQSKYNHLYQAVSFHQLRTATHSSQSMSSDYLYVSATKHGGLQSFHEPITLLQRNWKKIIDDQLQQQMDFEWNRAFENFSIDPHQYYLIPLTQLALKTDPLPGVSPEQSARLHEEISEAIYSSIVASFNKKEKESSYQSSIPLILIDKKGSHFQILYRTANGHYHYLKQKE